MSSSITKPFLYALFLLAILIGSAYYVLEKKGFGQLGNVVSFVGTLTLLTPPLRQLLGNFWFKRIQDIPASKDFDVLTKEAENTRVREYVSFSYADLLFFIVGVLMTCAGFLLSIWYSPNLAT